MRNYNKLIDRYPGADGMKTGFICASGYNLVASATRNGRRLIAVVLGAPSGAQRAETAASLLERGFTGGSGLGWLMPALGTVDALQPIAATPPNLRDEICGRHRGRVRTDHAAEEEMPAGMVPNASQADSGSNAYASQFSGVRAFGTASGEKVSLLGPLTPSMEPILVTVIPPAGAPTNPEAMLARSAKKRGVVAGSAQGRKSLAISVSTPSATDEPANGKPASAGAPNRRPRPMAATSKDKPSASITARLKPTTEVATDGPVAKPKLAKPALDSKLKPTAKGATQSKPKPAPKSAAAAPPAR
jgi:D-alanyl-D-alanine carboxypeptidase